MEDEKTLTLKVTQVIQLTQCSEELAALTLHQFNYEVAPTVDFLFDNDVNGLENVIKTKQRPSRRSIPSGSAQVNETSEICTTLESPEAQMPTTHRKPMEGISEGKVQHDRTVTSGESRRGGAGRRGRNRMRRSRGDVARQVNVGLGENFNKENEEILGNVENVIDTNPRITDSYNEKFVPRRRGPRRGANHSEQCGTPEESSFAARPNRYQGFRGNMRTRGGLQRGGFRGLREDGGGRVFSRREPTGEAKHFRGRENEYRQEADGWDASEGYGLTSSHDNVEEAPSWSGEPLILTNSKAAAQCVDQLMDANDASIQSILSQYSARVSSGEPTQVHPTAKESHEISNVREHLSISGLASGEDEKVDWVTWGTSPTPATTNLYNSVKAASSSSNTLQSASQALKEMIGVNGSLMANNHLHSSQVQAQQVSTQMNPEDPEVLRRGIFQRPQRSKPPPQPQKAPERPTDLPSQLRPEPLGSYSSGFRFGDDDLEENYLSKVIAPVFSKSTMPPSTAHSGHSSNLGNKDTSSSNTHLLSNVSSTTSELSSQPSQQRSQNYTQEATMHIRQQLGLLTTPPSNAPDSGNVRSPSQLSSSNEKPNHELHPSVQHSVPQLQPSQITLANNTTSTHKSINSSASVSNVTVSAQDSGAISNIQSSSYHGMDSYDRSTSQGVSNMPNNSPPNIQQQSAMQVNPQRMMPTPLMSSSYMPNTSSYNQPLSQFPQPIQPAVTGAMPQLDISNQNALLQALSSCLTHPQFQHMQSTILQAILQQSQFYSASGGNPSPPINAAASGMMAPGSHPPGLIPPHTATAGGYASVSLPGNIPPHQSIPPPNMMNMFAPQVTLSTGSTAPTPSADAAAALGQRNPYYSGMTAQHYFTQQQQHHLLLSAAAQSNSNASMGVSSGEQQPQTQMDETNNPPSIAEQQRNAMSSGSNTVDKYSNLKHMYPSPMKQQQSMGGVNNPQSQATQSSANSLFASSTSGTVGMDFHHAGHHTTPQGGIYISQNAAGNNTSAAYHHHPGMPASFVAASYNPQQPPQGSGNPHYLTQAVLMQPTGSVGGPKIPAMPHNTKNSVPNYSAWMNTAPNPGANASGNN